MKKSLDTGWKWVALWGLLSLATMGLSLAVVWFVLKREKRLLLNDARRDYEVWKLNHDRT